LAAGSVIHSLRDQQDMRRMGGLLKLLPLTYVSILIGSLSLVGFPFMSGFYSKDFILEVAASNSYWYSLFVYTLGVLAALFTAAYSMKLIILTFFYRTRVSKRIMLGVHEASLLMTIPLFVLFFCSIFFGFFFKEFFIGLGTDFWVGVTSMHPSKYLFSDSEFLSVWYKMLPVLLSLFVSLLIYLLFFKSYLIELPVYAYTSLWFYMFIFLVKKWYFDTLFNALSVKSLHNWYESVVFFLDRGVVLWIGPNLGILLTKLSKFRLINFLQSGYLYNYLFHHFLFLMSSLIFVCYFIIFIILFFWS